MGPKIKKALVIASGIIVFIVVVVVIAFQVFFRLPLPSYSGTLKLEGLKGGVEVRTDESGIPHIFAGNEDDLFFAQGYITARERMFQMDLTRLAGRGELSTLLGEATVKTDLFFKTMGFYRAAEKEYAALDPGTRAKVDAYTRGVNAWLATVKHLPGEYIILGGKPQPWKPADSLVGGLLMSYRLNAQRELKPILYQIYTAAGSKLFARLLPYVPEGAPMVSEKSGKKFTAARCVLPYMSASAGGNFDAEEKYGPLPMKVRASNWMIFAGSRTVTGKPIFSGSPDLEAAVPSLFYLVHLKGGAYDVIGGSIPGLPGVHTLGFNGRFAWSITVGNGDNLDFFVEKLNPENPNQYLTENGYKNFTVIEETVKIKAKKGAKEEKVTVKISRHGPVISDVQPGMPQNCAVMWAGLQGDGGVVRCFLELNKAKDFSGFRRALSIAKGGSVTVGYADVDGNIGYQYITTFPVRKSGDNPVPRPGEKGQYDWTGYLPFENHPYELNPRRGYVASFNQMPEPANFYGTAYFLFERPFRFEEIAKSKEKFSVDDIKKMQLDVVSCLAKRWVPPVLRACGGVKELEQYLTLLKNWNYAMDLDLPQPALFNTFFTRFMRNTLENKIGKKQVDDLFKDLHSTVPAQWLIRYMNDNRDPIWDDPGTAGVRETRDDLIVKSMKEAVAELAGRYGSNTKKWAWGKVHAMTIRHPLGGVLPFFNLSPIPHPGDDFTINAGWYDREHPFNMISGGAIRIIVDMADLDSMTIICPPGQSGLYLGRWYGDQADMWAKGGQVPARYRTAKDIKQVLLLEPVSSK